MPTSPKGSTPGLISPPPALHLRDGSVSSTNGPASPLSTSSLSQDGLSKSTLALTSTTDFAHEDAKHTASVTASEEKTGAQASARTAAVARDAGHGYAHDEEKGGVPELDNNWPTATLSRTATGAEPPYPEGGRQAWLVVFGSFMGMFCAFGFMNSIGVFHSYLHTHQLSDASSSTIGWIFSVYIFLSFGLGLQIGPLFDAFGPTLLLALGTLLLTLAIVAMSFCQTYWHFMLSVGVLAGTGTSLVFTPSISAIGHWFLLRRGAATGLAATGGSVGGIVFPLMLQRLFDGVGWAWALRVLALICALCGAVCVALVRSRLPRRPGSSVWPDMTILRDPGFALTTAGVFFMEWGLFIPITYLATYVESAHLGGADSSFPFTILAVLNAGSCLGRYLPGLFADKVGRFNSMIAMLLFCMLTSLSLWLPASQLQAATSASAAATVKALIIVYALLFGFASGSNISLTPVCVGQLCKTDEYGRYYATCYTIVAVGTLTGIPIAGALLQACGGGYLGVVLFTGGCYLMSTLSMTGARYMKVGWGFRKY